MSRILRTHTPLGALLKDRDIGVMVTARESNVPRQHLTEYLSGRTPIRRVHLTRLSEYFGVMPENLQTPPDVIERSLDALGRAGNWDHS